MKTKLKMPRKMSQLMRKAEAERTRIKKHGPRKPKPVEMPSTTWWLRHAKSPKRRVYRVMVKTVVADQGLGIDTEFRTDPQLDGTPNVSMWVRFEKGRSPMKAGDYYQVTIERIRIKPVPEPRPEIEV